MQLKICNAWVCGAFVLLAFARTAEAQAPLGVRALGMAGAFVGVADDASAVYWNPAGLATGAIFSVLATVGEAHATPGDTDPAERQTGTMVALSLPPIGLAYYRVASYGAVAGAPVVTGAPSREEVRRSVQALTTSTVGVSLLQSLTDYMVVAATPKLVRGSAARGFSGVLEPDSALDAAADLDGPGDTVFDIDAAVMVAIAQVRAGVVARNLTTPSFAIAEGSEIELSREVRAGVAWGSAWPGYSRLSLSLDADLTTRPTPFGDRRDVAGGVETWWRNRSIAVRAGARRSTVGRARSAIAGGVSWALRPSMFVEGHLTGGERSERGWSVGIRAGF